MMVLGRRDQDFHGIPKTVHESSCNFSSCWVLLGMKHSKSLLPCPLYVIKTDRFTLLCLFGLKLQRPKALKGTSSLRKQSLNVWIRKPSAGAGSVRGYHLTAAGDLPICHPEAFSIKCPVVAVQQSCEQRDKVWRYISLTQQRHNIWDSVSIKY